MPSVFLAAKDISNIFIPNIFSKIYRFCRKSGNDANNSDRGSHVICVIMTQCVRKSICDSVLTEVHLTFKISRMLSVHALSSCFLLATRRTNFGDFLIHFWIAGVLIPKVKS